MLNVLGVTRSKFGVAQVFTRNITREKKFLYSNSEYVTRRKLLEIYSNRVTRVPCLIKRNYTLQKNKMVNKYCNILKYFVRPQ